MSLTYALAYLLIGALAGCALVARLHEPGYEPDADDHFWTGTLGLLVAAMWPFALVVGVGVALCYAFGHAGHRLGAWLDRRED